MKKTRRDFLKTVAAPMVVAPFIIPSRVWLNPPSDRITMGFIGVGKQSYHLISKFLPVTQVLAVCDVDTTRRKHAKQTADNYYKENKDKGVGGIKEYEDYRELLEMKDIDTVCIATPDHWHAANVMHSLEKKKDVYCEKPLTHNIQEAIDIMKAVDKNKRVHQTGSQQRSSREFRVASELVRNGCIGKISHVECAFSGPPEPCDLPEETMEPGLDWNMWLGPAPMRPYNSILSPRGVHSNYPRWRSYREYGTGGVGDWGAHHIDIAQWGLGMDDSGPVEVKFIDNDATLVYANGIRMVHKQKGFGVHFFGSDGEVMVNRGRFKVILKGKTIAAHLGQETEGTTLTAEIDKAEQSLLKDAKTKLYVSTSHTDDFLSSVKSRKKPITNEQIGARTVICCHLINQLYYNNTAMKWDPSKLRFTGGTGNSAWLTRNSRDWTKA